MTKAEVVHVTGTTVEEICASYVSAAAHYAKGENGGTGTKPTKGVADRLRREWKAAFAGIGVEQTRPSETIEKVRSAAGAAAADAAKRVGDARTRSGQEKRRAEEDAASDRVDELVAEAKAPTIQRSDGLTADDRKAALMSAAGSGPSEEDVKAAAAQLERELNSPESQKAMEDIDRMIEKNAAQPQTDVHDVPAESGDDPFSKVLGIRKACQNKRGPGKKVTADELVVLVKAMHDAHPAYTAYQIQQTLYWVDGYKISHRTMDRAWQTAYGEVPTRGRGIGKAAA